MDKAECISPNREVMSERNYHIYCCAWCAVTGTEIDSHWVADEYNYAGDNGIVFG